MAPNEYGYRWVRGIENVEVAHYAAPRRRTGQQTVCRREKVGRDWDGPLDPVLPHLGSYPVADARCGACVVQYLVDTKQIVVKGPRGS